MELFKRRFVRGEAIVEHSAQQVVAKLNGADHVVGAVAEQAGDEARADFRLGFVENGAAFYDRQSGYQIVVLILDQNLFSCRKRCEIEKAW